MLPFLDRLTELVLPKVPGLDQMSLSNIFWALGTLRVSPAGKLHVVSRFAWLRSARLGATYEPFSNQCRLVSAAAT